MQRPTWSAYVLALLATPLGAAPPGVQDPPVELDPLIVRSEPPPVPSLRLNPFYPMEARRRWLEGCVVLRFTVRPDGKTDDFAVLESKPIGVFEKAVIGSVFKWRYEPSKKRRVVVELFEFRNQNFATQPRYSMRSGVKTPARVDTLGRTTYRLEMMLQGYSPPKCKTRI